ncbi:MAG TPA: PAM68 family protein [Leptolyngbyaceae cyanobacterium M65_K2018_010]|nr:PAM68 family protein [Leptolyngbyaceae cyanobacterium M65_K2018_010]
MSPRSPHSILTSLFCHRLNPNSGESKANLELPPYAVLFTTLGCFGLGVAGLTLGVLSTIWDEERVGRWLGLEELKVNFGRMTGAWGSRTER